MMMERLFVVWLQGYLKHAKLLVLEDDFVMLWSRHHRIQCWIPSRWIRNRTIIRHVTLASSVQRGLNSTAQPDWHNAQFPLNNPLHLKRDSEWFNVRFGSKADITLGPRHGRFASKSGHC
jgi:hypothetical protein